MSLNTKLGSSLLFTAGDVEFDIGAEGSDALFEADTPGYFFTGAGLDVDFGDLGDLITLDVTSVCEGEEGGEVAFSGEDFDAVPPIGHFGFDAVPPIGHFGFDAVPPIGHFGFDAVPPIGHFDGVVPPIGHFGDDFPFDEGLLDPEDVFLFGDDTVEPAIDDFEIAVCEDEPDEGGFANSNDDGHQFVSAIGAPDMFFFDEETNTYHALDSILC